MAREPLVYFVLIGALAFGVDAAVRRDRDTIRITSSVREDIARSLQARLGRGAAPPELQAELERWKQEQALYREGVKMGLLERDPVVRAHIASKLLQIAGDRDVLAEATDAQLRDFFARNRSRFVTPPAFDFDQVFILGTHADARAQAAQVLAKLRAGASPEGVGDWFPRGTHFSGMSSPDVAQLFGEEAAKGMSGFAVGEWNVVAGPRGFHALRVTAVDRGEPNFDVLRPALIMAFDAERRESAARAYAREVESRYRFVDSR